MNKEAQVSKDLESIEREEARDLGIQDFFTHRDKTNRGTDGLVNDAKETILNESSVKENLYEKSLKVKRLPDNVSPISSGVFLTARRNKLSENGIFLPTASFGKGSDTDMDVDFSEKQIVLACGKHAEQLKPGMEVVLNLENFKRKLDSTMSQKVNKEFKFVLPIEIIDGTEYLYVTERDIKYILNNKP